VWQAEHYGCLAGCNVAAGVRWLLYMSTGGSGLGLQLKHLSFVGILDVDWLEYWVLIGWNICWELIGRLRLY
jgi:hypothetical protein